MNKVVLMGRLTRDPEVRYGAVLHSGVTQNLQRSICAREQRLY